MRRLTRASLRLTATTRRHLLATLRLLLAVLSPHVGTRKDSVAKRSAMGARMSLSVAPTGVLVTSFVLVLVLVLGRSIV